jgi:hypothetical protein
MSHKIELEVQPESLVMFVTHNTVGNPSLREGPVLGDPALAIPYVEQLLDGQPYIQETIPTGRVNIVLVDNSLPRYTFLSPEVTGDELQQWIDRCGGKIEPIPWEFKMGQGATITEVGYFPGYDQFNHVVDFLNETSTLGGWSQGLKESFNLE